jgi:PAS domain S-box-containing protein
MLLNFFKRLFLSKKELFILENTKLWQKEQELKMTDLIAHTDEMIATYSNEGKLLFVNKAWRKNMLYTEEEVKSLYLYDILAPDSMPHAEENLKNLSAGKTIHNALCMLIAKDGNHIHVEGTLVPLFENGHLKSSRCFFRNINERKDAEDSKAHYITTLEEMLFNFSHKIRKPVASCLGLVDLIKSEQNLSEKQLKEYASYLNVSLKELDEYIHEMTEFLHQKKIKISGPE